MGAGAAIRERVAKCAFTMIGEEGCGRQGQMSHVGTGFRNAHTSNTCPKWTAR